jgi:hypothetical protein
MAMIAVIKKCRLEFIPDSFLCNYRYREIELPFCGRLRRLASQRVALKVLRQSYLGPGSLIPASGLFEEGRIVII